MNCVASLIAGMFIANTKNEVPSELAIRLFLKNVHVGAMCNGEPVHMHCMYPSRVLVYVGSVINATVFVMR